MARQVKPVGFRLLQYLGQHIDMNVGALQLV